MFKFLLIMLIVLFRIQNGVEAKEPLPAFYIAKDYSHLYGMEGFSNELLKLHFQLYQGYVKNANYLLQITREIDPKTYEFGALKRRLGWEFDGMRLHEYYFENLGGKKNLEQNSEVYKQIIRDFGQFDQWKRDFISTGLIRGIGWVVLYQDPQSGRLMNVWINEHDLGHIAGGHPLLIMDVFEHAYMPQYGLDRAKYIDSFFKNINWEEVSRRYEQSLHR